MKRFIFTSRHNEGIVLFRARWNPAGKYGSLQETLQERNKKASKAGSFAYVVAKAASFGDVPHNRLWGSKCTKGRLPETRMQIDQAAVLTGIRVGRFTSGSYT
jgi:hypothetical protein